MNRVLSCLGIVVFALVAIGLITLATASGAKCESYHVHENHFIFKQMQLLLIALGVFAVAYFFDYRHFRDWPWLTLCGYLAVMALLVVVVLFSDKTNGSKRWIKSGLGKYNIQPSEFAKIITVIALARFLDLSGRVIDRVRRGVLPACFILGVPLAGVVCEPDYGAAFVMGVTGGALFLVGGMRIKHLVVTGLAAGALGAAFVLNTPNRVIRILAWMPTWMCDLFGIVVKTDKEASHQLDMALVAFRNGGLFGVGTSGSNQKLAYLPEPHTDFIFAIGAEEWGLVFSILILALFTLLFVCGIYISARAPDRFGRLLAFGISFSLYMQALLNIFVVTGLFPTKGLALPFISYGGTNLVSAFVSVGLLFNIGRQIELPKCRLRSTLSPVYSTNQG